MVSKQSLLLMSVDVDPLCAVGKMVEVQASFTPVTGFLDNWLVVVLVMGGHDRNHADEGVRMLSQPLYRG